MFANFEQNYITFYKKNKKRIKFVSLKKHINVRNTLTMSVLELKGELLDMVSGVNNESILLRLKTAFKQVTETDSDKYAEYLLTPEQEIELAEAIEETYHEENLVSHEMALNELSRK